MDLGGGLISYQFILTKIVIGWFKLQLWMWFADLNYNFECDWLIELSVMANELLSGKQEYFKVHMTRKINNSKNTLI